MGQLLHWYYLCVSVVNVPECGIFRVCKVSIEICKFHPQGHWLLEGESVDEIVAKPEFSVEVPKTMLVVKPSKRKVRAWLSVVTAIEDNLKKYTTVPPTWVDV